MAQRYQVSEDVETGAFECVMDMLDRLSFFDGRRPKRTYMALMGDGNQFTSNDVSAFLDHLVMLGFVNFLMAPFSL